MEEPTEKTSYTLNHSEIDESDANKTESFALIEEDVPMLAKVPSALKEKGKSTEILAEPNESTALTDEKKETIKDDVIQTNPPAKNRFLRLFDKKTNKSEPTEQNGNGNGVSQPAEGAAPTAPKRRFIPAIKLQNPFAKKSETAIPTEDESAEKAKTAVESPVVVEGDEKKGKD
jgi:hypothetical protein